MVFVLFVMLSVIDLHNHTVGWHDPYHKFALLPGLDLDSKSLLPPKNESSVGLLVAYINGAAEKPDCMF